MQCANIHAKGIELMHEGMGRRQGVSLPHFRKPLGSLQFLQNKLPQTAVLSCQMGHFAEENERAPPLFHS
jgi:hypothetical protein